MQQDTIYQPFTSVLPTPFQVYAYLHVLRTYGSLNLISNLDYSTLRLRAGAMAPHG